MRWRVSEAGGMCPNVSIREFCILTVVAHYTTFFGASIAEHKNTRSDRSFWDA